MSRSKFVFGVRDVIRFVMRKNRIPFLCTTYELAVDFCNNNKKQLERRRGKHKFHSGYVTCSLLIASAVLSFRLVEFYFSVDFVMVVHLLVSGGTFLSLSSFDFCPSIPIFIETIYYDDFIGAKSILDRNCIHIVICLLRCQLDSRVKFHFSSHEMFSVSFSLIFNAICAGLVNGDQFMRDKFNVNDRIRINSWNYAFRHRVMVFFYMPFEMLPLPQKFIN